MSKPTVFISYRREGGADLARYLHDKLTDMGMDAFIDVDDLSIGKFASDIEKQIIQRQFFVAVLTPTTLESEWVRKEIQTALTHNRFIIPFVTREFKFYEHVPDDVAQLREFNAIEYDFRNPDVAFQKLHEGILKQHKMTIGRPNDPRNIGHAKPIRSSTERQQRNLETAMPACTRSGADSELRIKITLPDSEGLRAELPEVLPSGDVIQQSDVRASTFQAQFTKDPNTGELQAGTVCLEVTSLDFVIPMLLKESPSCASDQISLELDPDFDTRTVIVPLRAKNPKHIGSARVFVRAYQNGKIIAETAVSTQIVKSLNEHPSCGMWQLQMAKMTMGLGVLGGLTTGGNSGEIITEEESVVAPAQQEKKESERDLRHVDEDEIDTSRLVIDQKPYLEEEEAEENTEKLGARIDTIPPELQDQLMDVPETEAPEPEPTETFNLADKEDEYLVSFGDIEDVAPSGSDGTTESPAPPPPPKPRPTPIEQSQNFDLDFIEGGHNDEETVKSTSQRSQSQPVYGSSEGERVDDGVFAEDKGGQSTSTRDARDSEVQIEEVAESRNRQSASSSSTPAPQSLPMSRAESKAKSSSTYLRIVGAIAVVLFVGILGYGLWDIDEASIVTTEISYGDTVSDTLDDSIDELEYIFMARAGDVITIVLLLPIEEWAPVELLLFNDDDEIIAESYSMDGIESFTIPADGDYTIVLVNPASDETEFESVDFELILILDDEG